MNKKEFLDILYEQLSGQMPEGNVAAHVQYYRNYIEEEQRKGRSEDDILNELGSVAEGVKTSKAVCELAKKLNLEVPVSSAIYEAVYTDITPKEVLDKLMNRKLKAEEEEL